MAAQLLNKINYLDYILITAKSSDNRVSEANKFIYNNIQDLYANDISDRFLGAYTFSDGSPPSARQALESIGIHMKRDFKFNNI